MKRLVFVIVALVSFTQLIYSQEDVDLNEIKKIKLYLITSKKDQVITSKDLNSKTIIKFESEKIIDYFKDLGNCTFDALSEKKQFALRIYFSNKQQDFLLLLDQGVMFEIKKWNCYSIIQKDELKKFIQNIMMENGL